MFSTCPRRLTCESLEDRRLLATFGNAWPDARSLTVSFPADQAQIGAYSNSIRHVLDQVADRQQWQEAVLQAFQTWAVHSNVNIGLTTDRGDHFGAVGLTQNDPRFGEFRIGAFPQVGVLANALPFQPEAGSWAGDVLLNTQTNYFLGDWQGGSPVEVPPANAKGPAVELLSVLLHEAGNALGLADVDQPGAALHHAYQGPLAELSAADISALQSLYGGARQDIYEASNNDLRQNATPLETTAGVALHTMRGSLNAMGDIDHYQFTPTEGQEQVTVRLRAAGISLLKGHLEILNAQGEILEVAKANSVFENDLALEIGSLEDHSSLFVRVRANTNDVFGIGDYEIEIDYRPSDQQPPGEPLPYDLGTLEDGDLDRDEDDDDDDDEDDEDQNELGPVFNPHETVDQIFANAGLVAPEIGANDSLATASPLEAALGHLPGTRYEAQSAILATDIDYWRFTTASAATGPLSIHVDTLGLETPTLHVDVLDSTGNRVPARVLPKLDGSVSFVVSQPQAATEYFIRVQVAGQSAVSSGNYMVTVDQATQTAAPAPVLNGAVQGNGETWSSIRARKTQLFRFDLSATAGSTNEGLSLVIYNSRTANVVFSMSAQSGVTSTDYVWLQRGEYFVRLEALGRNGLVPGPVSYQLSADGISDDQGPLPIDPTDPFAGSEPYPAPPDGIDPNGIEPLPDPFGGANPFNPDPFGTPALPNPNHEMPPYEDPWYYDPYYDYYIDMYV